MQQPDQAARGEAPVVAAGRADLKSRADPVSGALRLARRTGTLAAELEYLSARSQSIFAATLAKAQGSVTLNLGATLATVREEFTLVAQVSVGIVIATLVVSMYLPIFKMGIIF